MDANIFCLNLTRALTETPEGKKPEVLAQELAGFFNVESHEVGLFRLDSAELFATFIWPENKLCQSIKVPVNASSTSILSATVKKRVGSMDNSFSSSQHLHMVEHSLLDREHCLPLQKVMAAPVIAGEKVRWVIQISRKGKTLPEAGTDFTAEQLHDLEVICRHIATLPL